MIGQTISHYKILEKLGEGGMGVVYKAEDTKLHRPVALKFLPLKESPSKKESERLIKEAHAAARLNHPNIATIFELGEVQDPSTHTTQTFIVMEYVEGKTLSELIQERPLPIPTVRDIVGQIARGIHAAHLRGIVHRDIKPTNIIVANDGVAKMLDFGVAKLISESTVSEEGLIVGSVAYMSPEQVHSQPVDARGDVWSLGVVLFQMLTARLPFRGEHSPAIMYAITQEEPAPLQKLRPDVPDDLALLCRRCLQKDPANRPQSMKEFLHLLGAGETGIPYSGWFRFLYLPHRGRVLAFTLLLAVSLFGAWYVLISAPAIELSPRDYVLIADIENQTGDRLFDSSIKEAIKVSLRQSNRFNILPAERIYSTFQLMGLPEHSPVDELTGISLARRVGAPVVLAAGVARFGSKYVLTGKIIETGSGETVALLRQEVSSIEDILSGVDRLSEDIRESLGESLSEISQTSLPLIQVTTSSLEALELYSRGDIQERQGNYEEAAILKGRSVELDSLFTMAVSDLSYIHRKLGNDSLALVYHRRVLPLIDRVTEREKFYILSVYYGPSFELDFRRAYESLRQLVVRYPDSPEGLPTLGHLAMFAGDFSQSIEAGSRYLSLDSVYAGPVYNNMGFAFSLAGRPLEALEHFAKSKALRPTYATIDMYMARAWWSAGQFDSTETVFLRVLKLGDQSTRLQAHLNLASFYHFKGQFFAARQHCLEGLKLSRSLQKNKDESWFLYLLGELAYDLDNTDEYYRNMQETLKRSESPFLEYVFVGASFARKRYFHEAAGVLRSLSDLKSVDPYFMKRKNDYYNFVEGEYLLAKSSTTESLKRFRSIKKIHAGDPLFFLAQKRVSESLFQSSDSSWEDVSQSILNDRGEVVTGLFISLRSSGFWVTELWPDIHAETGLRLARFGRKEDALTHLRYANAIWKNADVIHENAKAVRSALTTIEGR